MHLKESIFSVTGLVTPCMVSVPSASVGLAPLNLANFPVKVAVGYFAASNISADFACSSSLGMPKLMEFMSTVTSMEPDFASLS